MLFLISALGFTLLIWGLSIQVRDFLNTFAHPVINKGGGWKREEHKTEEQMYRQHL